MGARTERNGFPDTPLSDSIMSAQLPERFQLPVLEPFDGESDAKHHLAVFNAHMMYYGYDIATDPAKCRAFPTTFGKHAIRWFFNLPPRSINSFSDLSAKFLEQYALAIPFPQSSTVLHDCRQGRHESLREYFKRFNQLALQVDDLAPCVAIHYIGQGLKPGRFADSLLRKPPQDLLELRRTASKYVNIEEEEERRRRRTN